MVQAIMSARTSSQHVLSITVSFICHSQSIWWSHEVDDMIEPIARPQHALLITADSR